MRKRIIEILVGLIAIGCGYIFYSTGWSTMYGFPVPKAAGILLIIFGIVEIGLAFRRKAK